VNRAFTLVELIFVILIIGLLASFLFPKFKNITSYAKDSSIKIVVNSIQNEVENLHAKWLINEDFVWISADGNERSNDWNNTSGYPAKLDSGAGDSNLFSYIFKVPIKACKNSSNGCFEEYEDNKYEYNYSANKALRFEYNSSNGSIVCLDGVGLTKQDCEDLINK